MLPKPYSRVEEIAVKRGKSSEEGVIVEEARSELNCYCIYKKNTNFKCNKTYFQILYMDINKINIESIVIRYSCFNDIAWHLLYL